MSNKVYIDYDALQDIVLRADKDITSQELRRGLKQAERLSADPKYKFKLQALIALVEIFLGAAAATPPMLTKKSWRQLGIRTFVPRKGASLKDVCLEHSVQKTLGRGAFGTAYLINMNGKPVVAKVETLTNWRLSRLSELLKSVEMTKIAGIMKIGPHVHDTYVCRYRDKYHLVIIMDYVKGPTLSEWAKTATRDELSRASFILKNKLARLHEVGIVHGDIGNPDNTIIIIQGGKMKDAVPIDFGLSMNPHNIELQQVDRLFNYVGKSLSRALAGHLILSKLVDIK